METNSKYSCFIKSSIIRFSVYLLVILLIYFYSGCTYAQHNTTTKIWDYAPHSAFTSLIRFDGNFYCCFREAASHVDRYNGGNGKIRVLKSKDGLKWFSHTLIAMDGSDLRDPQLSETPDGKLMLLMAECRYLNGVTLYSISVVSFMQKREIEFSEPKPIQLNFSNKKFDWLWKVNWFNGIAYGVLVVHPEGCFLVRSKDGINYEIVTNLDLAGYPNEADLNFQKNGDLRIIIRRDSASQKAYLGESTAPYTNWTWSDLGVRIGGPDILTLPDGLNILASRDYTVKNMRTTIYKLGSDKKLTPLLYLPSGGDCSYPGMVIKNRKIYVSYYSSHEGKASIYMSIISLRYLKRKNILLNRN